MKPTWIIKVDLACLVKPQLRVDWVCHCPGHHVDNQKRLHSKNNEQRSLSSFFLSRPPKSTVDDFNSMKQACLLCDFYELVISLNNIYKKKFNFLTCHESSRKDQHLLFLECSNFLERKTFLMWSMLIFWILHDLEVYNQPSIMITTIYFSNKVVQQ